MPRLLTAVTRGNHVELVVQGEAGDTSVDVIRNDRTEVRGGEGLDLTASLSHNLVDWEAPQGPPTLSYAAVFDTPAGPVVLRTTTSGVDFGGDWIMPVGYPDMGMEVVVESGGVGALERDIGQSTAYVVGRADPVVVSHGRRMFVGTFTLLTLDDAARTKWLHLIRYPYVVFFPRPGFGWDEPLFLSLGRVVEERTVGLGSEPSRRWLVDVTQIARPPAHYMEAPPQRTWQDVKDDNADWNMAWLTYKDVLDQSGRTIP